MGKIFNQRPSSGILRIAPIFLKAECAIGPLKNIHAPKAIDILKALENLGPFVCGACHYDPNAVLDACAHQPMTASFQCD